MPEKIASTALEVARERVPGDVLSCYTAAIAHTLHLRGVDPSWSIGTQLFLAIRDACDDDPSFEFVHYHTPLLGAGSLAGLALFRHGASTAKDAARAIGVECRKGPVIVSGDTWHLPWHVARGVRHSPHWFVVDFVTPDGARVHIGDAFSYSDDQGEQLPHSGWYGLEELSAFSVACRDRSRPYCLREKWALGAPELAVPADPHQWLTTSEAGSPVEPDAAVVRGLFATSLAFAERQRARADLCGGGWHHGSAALRMLSVRFRDFLGHPKLYECANDVWVAARSRAFFARTLRRAATELAIAEAGPLASACEEMLLPLWNSLPQLLRYNLASIERGRRPRLLLADATARLADAEDAFVIRFRRLFEGTPDFREARRP